MISISIKPIKGVYVATAVIDGGCGGIFEKAADTEGEARASLVRYLLRHGLIPGVIIDPPCGAT